METTEYSEVRSAANGLARSNHPGGISTEGAHSFYFLLCTLSSGIACRSS